ncbi:hypothetical protein MPSEU_000614200 [Mayamaea pseudoterrestris]|nr:hypothetical protein MPSEU_000614200 [Mayamaea pseudoterrestris]
MPFLKKQGTSRHHRSSSLQRARSRREEDGFIFRGAEILRQQIKKQDDFDLAYYSKLDPDGDLQIDSSSDERMDTSWSPTVEKRKGTRRKEAKKAIRVTPSKIVPRHAVQTPLRVYQSQSSELFPDMTDDDMSLFTTPERSDRFAPPPPPPPPRDDLDSSFSFLDDTEWADMQRKSTLDDVGVFSPAWSMAAKNVSDDEGPEDEVDDEDELKGDTIDIGDDEFETNEGLLDDDAVMELEETTKMNNLPAACQVTPAAVIRSSPPAQNPRFRTPFTPPKTSFGKELFNVSSPLSSDYDMLMQDPAFRHALNAGQCWQSLVGQLVRFPSNWWNGARGPPLGVPINHSKPDQQPLWQFRGRYRVCDNRHLKKLIPHRASPGMLLIHLIVQDLMTLCPVQDIVVGVYHPNARGIRRTAEPNPQDEASREVWLAVRKREECVTVVDHLLNHMQQDVAKSPLGPHHVTNHNMRAVFGDNPPMDTMFLVEDVLYQRLSLAMEGAPELSPAEAILQEFVFED